MFLLLNYWVGITCGVVEGALGLESESLRCIS